MNNILSLIFYISSFLLSSLALSVGVKRNSGAVKLLAISIPILIIGLRFDVGTDYTSYLTMFQQYQDLSFVDFLAQPSSGRVEIGFFALIKIASLFTKDPWLVMFLAAVITIGFAYVAIKRLTPKHIPLTFLLYLFLIVPFAMNGVRQGMAVSIIFFAYSYIQKGKLAKYVVTVLLTSLFHTSAIAMLPLYLLRYITIKKRHDAYFTLFVSLMIAILSILFVPMVLLVVSLIPGLNSYVRYGGFEAGIAKSDLIVMGSFAVILIATYRRVISVNPSMELMATLSLLEFASIFLGGISAALSRMSYYLAIGMLTYMANIPSIHTRRSRRIAQFIVISFGILYFTYFYYICGYSDIFPYVNVLAA